MTRMIMILYDYSISFSSFLFYSLLLNRLLCVMVFWRVPLCSADHGQVVIFISGYGSQAIQGIPAAKG